METATAELKEVSSTGTVTNRVKRRRQANKANRGGKGATVPEAEHDEFAAMLSVFRERVVEEVTTSVAEKVAKEFKVIMELGLQTAIHQLTTTFETNFNRYHEGNANRSAGNEAKSTVYHDGNANRTAGNGRGVKKTRKKRRKTVVVQSPSSSSTPVSSSLSEEPTAPPRSRRKKNGTRGGGSERSSASAEGVFGAVHPNNTLFMPQPSFQGQPQVQPQMVEAPPLQLPYPGGAGAPMVPQQQMWMVNNNAMQLAYDPFRVNRFNG